MTKVKIDWYYKNVCEANSYTKFFSPNKYGLRQVSLELPVNRHIVDWWGVCVPSFMIVFIKGKLILCQLPFSVINALWPWPLDPKIDKGHPKLMGSLCVIFHDDRCKSKGIMQDKQFSVFNAFWPWPFDHKINRTHPQLIGSLCVKFHDDKCEGNQLCNINCFR